MSSLFIGFLLIVSVVVFSLDRESLSYYWQMHSLLLVLGGTISVLFLSNSTSVLRSLYRSMKTLLKGDESFEQYTEDLIQIVQARTTKTPSHNPLIAYATELWSQGVNQDLFVVLLSQRRKELESRAMDATQTLKNLAKYPPALGMAGTVMGMITLFAKLDSSKDNIGANLSMAMTATLFGLFLTNALISPLADRLHVRQMNQQRIYDSLYEIILLVNNGEPAALIREELKARAA